MGKILQPGEVWGVFYGLSSTEAEVVRSILPQLRSLAEALARTAGQELYSLDLYDSTLGIKILIRTPVDEDVLKQQIDRYVDELRKGKVPDGQLWVYVFFIGFPILVILLLWLLSRH